MGRRLIIHRNTIQFNTIGQVVAVKVQGEITDAATRTTLTSGEKEWTLTG